jgi:chemotaxis protein methyltransferase CheR
MSEIARLIERFERWTGLDLRRGSSHTALERYLKAQLPADDPAALTRYVDDLSTPHHPEAVRLVDAITVCHSSFYRDPEQLAGLTAVLRTESSRRAMVWVPACATGEDAYSIAMLAEGIGRSISILATDINTRALSHAVAGIYGPWSVRDLPPSMGMTRRPDGRFEVPDRLRRVITFTRHNLMDVAPSSPEGWDVIVCRNVLMYFARDRVTELLGRLGAALRPGGYLFVGANDIFERAPAQLRFVRIGARHALWRPTSPTTIPPVGMLAASADPTPPAGLPVVSRTTTRPSTPQPLVGVPAGSGPTLAPPATASSSGSMPAMTSTPAAAPAAPATASSSGSMPAMKSPPPTTPPPMANAAASIAISRTSSTPSPARAHTLLLDGKTSDALELALAVLDVDPLCVEARLLAGVAYQLSGDAQQAATALRAALVLVPDLWPAEMYLAFALTQLGDEAGSRRALRRGAQLAVAAERLPLSPSVAAWFEGWRVDVIEMGRATGSR